MHVLLDVLLALQPLAHRLQRAAEVAEFPGHRGSGDALAGGDGVRVAAQAAELARQPPGGQQADSNATPSSSKPQRMITAWLRSMNGAIVGSAWPR